MVALRLLGVLAVLALASNCVNSVEEDYYYEYGDLVEHYPDYIASHTYSIIQPHVDNTTLKKCFCNVDQVWNGSFCHETGTLVLVSNFHIDSAVPVNTSAFGSASVGEVTCPEGTLHFELGKNFSEYDHFYILDTGSLYWNEGIFDNYCVENIYGYNGLPNDWFAQICLEAPVIPKCCPEGYAFDDNGNCVESLVNGVFSPPVYVAGHKQFWPKVTTHGISNPLCEESEETHIVDLDNKNAVLYYDPKMALLVWESPFTLRDQDFIHKYCVVTRQDENLETNYVAKLCYLSRMKDHEEKCRNRTCVRKCCASHETASLGCAPVDPTSDMPIFQPVFHHSTNHSAGAKKPEDLTIVHGFPLCKEYFMLRPHEEENDKFYLLTNGYLHAPSFSNDFPPTRYCLDTFTEGNKSHLLPLICFGDEDSTHNICESVKKYLYPILLLTSVGFLAITVIVYISVPELHAKVHGKCLVSHVTALLVAYASLFIVQKTTDSLSEFGCKFMASVTHISFLAAFFWLNVMCFDIWWTLKSMRPVPETGELSRLRFKLYSLYSWGCPLVIGIASVVVQSLPDDYSVIRPNFGNSKCWFEDNRALWAYFYGFVVVLVVANIIFFAQVAYILIEAQNDPILQRTRQQNRERMWLYVKLFLVMGITWITEVVSWQEGTCEAWIFTDIINALQGVSIFLIFVCKRNLLKKIRSKWEPYLRHVKNFVGSKRLSHSKFSTFGTGNTAREQMSFSSSENRPNHSAASHRTVESQLSFDPLSASRKISTGSMTSSTGIQVHSQCSIPLDTIAESSNPEYDNSHLSHTSSHHSPGYDATGNNEMKSGYEGSEYSGPNNFKDVDFHNRPLSDINEEEETNEQKLDPEFKKPSAVHVKEKSDQDSMDGNELQSKENININNDTMKISEGSSSVVSNDDSVGTERDHSHAHDNEAFSSDDEPIHL